MATDDDLDPPRGLGDPLDQGAVPEPDEAPSPSERVRARDFGELVDKVVAGPGGAGRLPAAMSAEARTLLEVATAIRASTGNVSLEASRRSAIVEDALRMAIERRGDRGGTPVAAAVGERDAPPADLPRAPTLPAIDGGARRRFAPWLIAAASTGVAAAAALALWLGRAQPVAMPEVSAALPMSQRSRPADELVGRIPRERAGEAAARLDAIYADRLAGYRERTLARRGHHGDHRGAAAGGGR